MDLEKYADELIHRNYSLDGSDPVPEYRRILQDLADRWQDPVPRILLNQDLKRDRNEVVQGFRGILTRHKVPTRAQVIGFWIIGAGPDYPIGISGWERMPLPITAHCIEDDAPDELGKCVYEPPAPDDAVVSKFLLTLERENIEKRGENEPDGLYQLHDGLLWAYGHLMFPHIVAQLRRELLAGAAERYILYGFHGEGDTLIMGRLTPREWTPVQKLIESTQE